MFRPIGTNGLERTVQSLQVDRDVEGYLTKYNPQSLYLMNLDRVGTISREKELSLVNVLYFLLFSDSNVPSLEVLDYVIQTHIV